MTFAPRVGTKREQRESESDESWIGGRPAAGPEGRQARAGGKDGPQIVRSKGNRWTEEAEEIFLDQLAVTANYTLAAKACGFSREAIYRRRRRDPGFAERCRAAIAQAVDRIDALLVEGAERALEGLSPDPASPIPPMTVAEAIQVVKLHRPSVTGRGRLAGWRGRPRPLAEVKASILRKLSAIERHRADPPRDGGGDAGQA